MKEKASDYRSWKNIRVMCCCCCFKIPAIRSRDLKWSYLKMKLCALVVLLSPFLQEKKTLNILLCFQKRSSRSIDDCFMQFEDNGRRVRCPCVKTARTSFIKSD